jgi:hypothetical protein
MKENMNDHRIQMNNIFNAIHRIPSQTPLDPPPAVTSKPFRLKIYEGNDIVATTMLSELTAPQISLK